MPDFAFAHGDLVAELRLVRERGLLRLRHAPLPALTAVVERMGLATEPDLLSSSVRTVLGRVVEGLDAGTLASAAAYTFGLVPGTRDWPGQERRRRAAGVYGVTPERFRKSQERVLVEQVAQEILELCQVRPEPAEGTGGGGPVAELPIGGRRRVGVRVGDRVAYVTVCRTPVQALRDVDVLVSSENIYLEMSKAFKSSLSAGLRGAAVVRNGVGELVDDVLQRELRSWLRTNGREGMAVTPGTVVATSSGELLRRGVRRVYHAATAIPRTNTNDYDIEPTGVVRAVHNVFQLARQERDRFHPSLSSICFPLFGAGRGGLDPETSFAYLWAGLEPELSSGWDVILLTRSKESCATVLGALGDLAGGVASDPTRS